MTVRAKIKIEGGGAVSAAVGALTPEQLAIVQVRINAVPPRWRDKFLRGVADQLALTRLPTKLPTNREVLDACGVARRALAVGIGVPSVESW
jgi:hypothetical protein